MRTGGNAGTRALSLSHTCGHTGRARTVLAGGGLRGPGDLVACEGEEQASGGMRSRERYRYRTHAGTQGARELEERTPSKLVSFEGQKGSRCLLDARGLKSGCDPPNLQSEPPPKSICKSNTDDVLNMM